MFIYTGGNILKLCVYEKIRRDHIQEPVRNHTMCEETWFAKQLYLLSKPVAKGDDHVAVINM